MPVDDLRSESPTVIREQLLYMRRLWLAITLPILRHKGIILKLHQVGMAEPLLPTSQLLKVKLVV